MKLFKIVFADPCGAEIAEVFEYHESKDSVIKLYGTSVCFIEEQK